MTLHLSQIFRTDARTFIALSLFIPISDAPAIQIIRRKLDQNSIARKDANEVFAHFAGDMRQHLMLTFFQLDPKHCVWQCFKDFRHDLYRLFLRHTERQTQICLCWQTSNTNMRPWQCQAEAQPARGNAKSSRHAHDLLFRPSGRAHKSEHLGALVRDCDGVLRMRTRLPIDSHHRPAILERLRVQ